MTKPQWERLLGELKLYRQQAIKFQKDILTELKRVTVVETEVKILKERHELAEERWHRMNSQLQQILEAVQHNNNGTKD